MFEMGLGVGSHKCKGKLPLTFMMKEQALWGQFTPLSVKSSILQLVLALNSLTGQCQFDRFGQYIFT